jgi:hypothetical protein
MTFPYCSNEDAMGFHVCQYLDTSEACSLGLRYADCLCSSGDVTLHFGSGRSWLFPDMLPLYLELGWAPPMDFIIDVMSGPLLAKGQRGALPMRIGYLSPETHPLPRPFRPHRSLPAGFFEVLDGHLWQAQAQGNRWQTKGPAFNL